MSQELAKLINDIRSGMYDKELLRIISDYLKSKDFYNKINNKRYETNKIQSKC